MAVSIDNFRSALNGFNRTDVVQFFQKITAEHEKELRVAREENSRLQSQLEEIRRERDALTEEKSALLEQLAEAQKAPAVEEPVTPVLDAPIAPAAVVSGAAVTDFNEMELAAYRRAEMTERMARERAAASAERMRSIFAQADAKLRLSVRDMDTLSESFRTAFDQLQQVLETAQGIVAESSDGLKAAQDICAEP